MANNQNDLTKLDCLCVSPSAFFHDLADVRLLPFHCGETASLIPQAGGILTAIWGFGNGGTRTNNLASGVS